MAKGLQTKGGAAPAVGAKGAAGRGDALDEPFARMMQAILLERGGGRPAPR
jgi:hypothetical protein